MNSFARLSSNAVKRESRTRAARATACHTSPWATYVPTWQINASHTHDGRAWRAISTNA